MVKYKYKRIWRICKCLLWDILLMSINESLRQASVHAGDNGKFKDLHWRYRWRIKIWNLSQWLHWWQWKGWWIQRSIKKLERKMYESD